MILTSSVALEGYAVSLCELENPRARVKGYPDKGVGSPDVPSDLLLVDHELASGKREKSDQVVPRIIPTPDQGEGDQWGQV